MSALSAAGAPASVSNVTFPLASTVRTASKPRPRNTSARSALRIVMPPTLTPRRSATHAVMSERELEAEARGQERDEVARHLREVRRRRHEGVGPADEGEV